MSFFKEINVVEYLVYINLKVFSLTYFVFFFFSKVDMVKFFSFSKDLSYLLTITLSQIYSYKKTFEDFRLAYKARVIKKVKNQEEGFIKRTFEFFLKKAMSDSKERSLALKARGFFDD
jgi:cobalt/nickel transport system permease protein